MELPNASYDVLLIDPPWSYYGDQTKMGAAANHYGTMTDQELKEFPVASIMNKKAVVFLWATAPRLDFAIDLIRAWGLFYRGVAFTWVKTNKNGVPIGAQGVRPSVVKPTAEFVLVASNVKRGRPLPLNSEKVRHVVLEQKQEHSRKPDAIHERINELYPTNTKIELFARRPYPGWAAWGNELTNKETE